MYIVAAVYPLLYEFKKEKYLSADNMNEEHLLEIIKKLLKTDEDLNFLLELAESDLRKLVVCIRERFDQVGNNY
jgi:predicted glycosyltransferase involved in capsule biosynthesis